MKNSRIGLGMGLLVLFKVNATWAAASAHTAEMDVARLKAAFSLLEKTESGKAALERANEMKIPIQSAAISKTEIVATRTLSSHHEEKLSYQVQILVAKDKDPVFQALDLAHELVHATNPKRNPFDPKLSAAEYVRHGIEGEGGEAQAIAQECRVGKELIENQGTSLKNETVQVIKARCQFVWNTERDESKWKQSFYQVGQYYRQFVAMLSRTESNLKVEAKSPMFASAVAHKPYPLALLEEYIEITRRICEKNRKIASEAVSAFEERCRTIHTENRTENQTEAR